MVTLLRYPAIAALTVLCVVTVGCGGGGGGDTDTANESSGGYSSGLDRDKMVEQLSQDERAQLCSAATPYFERVADPAALCTYVGLSISLNNQLLDPPSRVSACEAQRSECIDSYDELTEGSEDFQCDLDKIAGQNCDVSVATFEECVSATFDAILTPYESLRCDDAAVRDDLQDVEAVLSGAVVPPTAACQTMQRLCPAFFAQD